MRAQARYEALARGFVEHFGEAGAVSYFSAPGRSEIIGNHTDHNGGKILAASITMDSICVAAPTKGSLVRIVSEGYGEPIVVDLARLDAIGPGAGSTPLVAGLMVALREQGCRLGGFDAYVSSEVIPSVIIGCSSSCPTRSRRCTTVPNFPYDLRTATAGKRLRDITIWSPSRRSWACPSSSWAWGRAPTTWPPSTPRDSSTPCWPELA